MFSIIVANYNNGRFLPELVNSVLCQTSNDWELLITDDCSTDNSREIISQLPSDERIKIIYHPHNQGASAAFKTGADNSVGEIMGIMGADDALAPDAIEKMIKAHKQHPEASIVHSDSFACDADLVVTGVNKDFRGLAPGEELIRSFVIGNFQTFKRSAYKKTEGLDPGFKKGVDVDLCLKLDEVGSVVYVPEPLYLYRRHPGGISQAENGVRAAQYGILAKEKAYKRRCGTSKANLTQREYTQMMIVWYLREALNNRNRDEKECNRLLLEGVKRFPTILLRKAFYSIVVRNNLARRGFAPVIT